MNETDISRKSTWIPAKERKWIILFMGLTGIWVLYGLWNMYHPATLDWHSRNFKETMKEYGSNARLVLFAVLAYYVLSYILKQRWLNPWNSLKKFVIRLIKITRKFHAPLAILAIGLIALHIVGAFLYGFQWDFTDISGLLAGIVLVGVPIAGVLRYRRLDRTWHLRLGLVFAALFFIHAFL
jgi:hypothetical protein